MSRKTLRGNETIKWFPAGSLPADPDAITAAEQTAATNITGVAEQEAAAAHTGWESTPSVINTPDVLSLVTGTIPGETTFGIASIEYYTDDTTNAVWDLLTEGSEGGVAFFLFGTATGDDYGYFPVAVVNRRRKLSSGNEPEMHVISFSIKGEHQGSLVA